MLGTDKRAKVEIGRLITDDELKEVLNIEPYLKTERLNAFEELKFKNILYFSLGIKPTLEEERALLKNLLYRDGTFAEKVFMLKKSFIDELEAYH